MLAVGVLAAAAALVLGLRFSVVTLVLLGLATVIYFATSVLGGSGPLVVGLQCWRRLLLSKSVTSLAACLQRIFPCEPSYLFDTAYECAALHSGNTFQERLKAACSGHCAIIFDPKDQVVGRLALA